MAATLSERGLTRRIQAHSDLLAPVYAALWGGHIHHGYWDGDADAAPPRVAQARLLAELWGFAGSPAAPLVLDIGCGFGGSLLWLARHAGACGLGLTLSPAQRLIAQAARAAGGQRGRLRAARADAQQRWPLSDGAVSLVWCVECSAHLLDRALFAAEAYRVPRPSGRLELAAGMAGERQDTAAKALRQRVERGMLCHPFGSAAGYVGWLRGVGFASVAHRDVTRQVEGTWAICIGRRERAPWRWLARSLGRDVRAFAAAFDDLLAADRGGAMAYGSFVVRRRATGAVDPSSGRLAGAASPGSAGKSGPAPLAPSSRPRLP